MARLNWYNARPMVCIEYTFHGVVPDYSRRDLPRIGLVTLSFMPKDNHQTTRRKLEQFKSYDLYMVDYRAKLSQGRPCHT